MSYTYGEMLDIAMAQSARDMGCSPGLFRDRENRVTGLRIGEGARAYFTEPVALHIVSYGNNAVAAAKPEFSDIAAEFLEQGPFYQLFEAPAVCRLDRLVSEKGYEVRFMADYSLAVPEKTERLSCPYRLELLTQKDFADLYLPQWGNALCEKRKELDVLGLGAYDGDRLIGLAGCSADCGEMWQIGVDVLPGYRRQGIASALTSNLAAEIMLRGKVPFYCSAWSNIRSRRNAIRSGFRPAWVEITVKPVEEMQ